MKLKAMSGFTLVELVVAITLIGICSATLLGFMSTMAARNAEVLMNQQATQIAAAYLQEVLSKPFDAAPGGGSRENFNDVGDYALLDDVGAHDQRGIPIAGLDNYRIAVRAFHAPFGTTPANTIAALRSYRVEVTVTDQLDRPIVIAGYKTKTTP